VTREADTLLIYMEPAPYIVALLRNLRPLWGGRLDVRFLSPALTQQWKPELHPEDGFLPADRKSAIRAVRQMIASGKYSLVHLAGWGHPVLRAAMCAAWRRGIPVTVESDTPAGTGGGGWKGVIKALLYPWLFRIPARFLPAGSAQAANLRRYGVKDDRIRIAGMTVDVTHIRAFGAAFTAERRNAALARYGISEPGPRFLFLGRLEPHKGLDDLLAAFAVLGPQCPDALLLVAGSGSLGARIDALAAENPRVRALGRLSDEEVWEAYRLADIFVLPSHFEPWGLVVNEALASGLPVIVSARAGCVPDLVDGKDTGLIVPAGDPVALSQAMLSLAHAPERRRAMSGNAERLMQEWTLEAEAARVASAWREALT